MLKKQFPIRQGEWGIALTLGFILFANYAAMGITKVVSVSGFLSQVKDHYILLVWAVDMALLILATGVQSLIVDRFNRIKLLMGVLLVFAALYVFLSITFKIPRFPASVSYALVYLLNDQQWRFFPVVFWILVNDIYDPATGRRITPLVANFAFLGTIVGLAVAAVDARVHFGTFNLLILNAAIFILAWGIARSRLQAVKLPPPARSTDSSIKKTLTEGWEFINTVPAFAYLALGMLAAGCIMTILLFKAISDAKFDLAENFQTFYAFYNLAIAFASIILQSYSSRIIEWLTLKRSFLIQPFVMAISVVVNFFAPGFMVSAVAQGISRATYDTLDLSARRAFQAMVPNEKRGRVSMFIDSYLPSGGTIIGSLLTFAIIALALKFGLERDFYTRIYVGVGVVIAAISVYASFHVRATYEQSMLNWQLKRRSRAASVLDKLDFDDKE